MSELRLFISSTFRDLQEEREHLVKKVFPEIRAACRQRGVTFTEIDLRWGLTDEEGALGRVIRICLEEVDRCKPYFIGLLGSSYGWVPDLHDVHIDAELLTRYPWVEQAVIEGASLTELEFIEGVFSRSADDPRHALFYQRRNGTLVHDGDERLRRLSRSAQETGFPFREFSSVDEMGSLVRDDLLSLIDSEWPVETAPSQYELERRSHAAFAVSRSRAYIPQQEYLTRIRRWIDEESRPLAIVAPSGMGKSSLVAHLATLFRGRHNNALVIEHYVGASDGSTTLVGTIRHIADAVRDRFGTDDRWSSSGRDIDQSLPLLLHHLAQVAEADAVPVMIVIDAVNMMEERAQSLLWIPEELPGNIRLVVSTTPGVSDIALSKHDWDIVVMSPINDDRVRQSIVVRYLGEFHKGIAPDQLRRLTADSKAGSPLFLRVVAEELRLHGEHESVVDVVTRYVEAGDIEEVFQILLERLERDFGEATVSTCLPFLWASRNGLAEHELLGLLEITRVELSRLLFALDYHVIRRGGLLGFFHDHLRRAVERRYIPDAPEQRRLHGRVAAYFASLEYDSRRRDEEPWQWRAAEGWQQLADCLSHPAFIIGLNDPRVRHERLAYWHSLEGHYDPVTVYDNRLRTLRGEGEEASRRAEIAGAIGECCVEAGRYAAAEPLLRIVHRYQRRVRGPNSEESVAAMENLATVLYHEGNYQEAESLWREALRILEVTRGNDDPRLCPVLDSLAACAWRRSDSAAIEQYCRRSLDIAERHYGREHPQSLDRLVNLAEFEMHRENNHNGVLILESVVDSAIIAYGPDHPTTLRYQVELGFALRRSGAVERALAVLNASLQRIVSVIGTNALTARCLENLGLAYAHAGRFDEGAASFGRAYRIRRDIHGKAHPDAMHALRMYAYALREAYPPHQLHLFLDQLSG